MSIIFVQDTSIRVSVILSSTGAPVTGLTFADVTSYISKNGAAPVAFALTGVNFTELDAVNMPGVYNVLVPDTLTDTLGELVLSFSGGSFDTYLVRGYVYTAGFSELFTLLGQVDTQATSNGTVLATIDTTTTNTQATVGGISTNVTNIQTGVTDIQGAGFATGTDSLASIRDDFDTRIPDVTAQRSDLVNGAGNLTPPADVGLWDVLGDGTVSVSDLGLSVERVLGLSQENYRVSSQTYDANDNLISGVIKIYPSKADLDADTNETATYVIAASYDSSNRLISYTVGKQP